MQPYEPKNQTEMKVKESVEGLPDKERARTAKDAKLEGSKAAEMAMKTGKRLEREGLGAKKKKKSESSKIS